MGERNSSSASDSAANAHAVTADGSDGMAMDESQREGDGRALPATSAERSEFKVGVGGM